jgi:hypothetical protein
MIPSGLYCICHPMHNCMPAKNTPTNITDELSPLTFTGQLLGHAVMPNTSSFSMLQEKVLCRLHQPHNGDIQHTSSIHVCHPLQAIHPISHRFAFVPWQALQRFQLPVTKDNISLAFPDQLQHRTTAKQCFMYPATSLAAPTTPCHRHSCITHPHGDVNNPC